MIKAHTSVAVMISGLQVSEEVRRNGDDDDEEGRI